MGVHRVRLAIAAVVAIGVIVRLSVFTWQVPFSPHHPDEAILPLESIALWEGITPREVGWPASTTRLLLSAVHVGTWLSSEPSVAALGREPFAALNHMAAWIGQQYVDPSTLYRIDRLVIVASGALQLIVLAWALGRWVGPTGTMLGTLAVAIAPMPVEYSQYILADMTGTLFVTAILGLAARPTPASIRTMGAFAGLGAASKLHFGIWLLTPLLCVWVHPDVPRSQRTRLAIESVLCMGLVFLALVPWFWLNPFLALKEVAGVVAVKISGTGRSRDIAANLTAILGGLGWLMLVGAAAGAAVQGWRDRRMAPIIIPTILGTLALTTSSIVFDRYGLVLLPGVVLLAACGWQAGLQHAARGIRFGSMAMAGICAAFTVAALVTSQQSARETDVDVQTSMWLRAHVERGRRIARHDEDNTYLPQTREQLEACAVAPVTSSAYRDKLRIVGWAHDDHDPVVMPMQLAVLNDEFFRAYWCRRELAATQDAGFHLVAYHSEPRFGAVLEREAIADFRSGDAGATGGVDVLVTNRRVDVGREPAAQFTTRRGQRLVYIR